MMIHINAVSFDPLGSLTINARSDSDIRNLRRRVNRVQTLDLDVAFNDRGFSHGDRTFDVRWQGTESSNATARRLTQDHGLVNVSTDEGLFEARIESFNEGPRESGMRLLIKRRIAP